jgi:hypothetical protein
MATVRSSGPDLHTPLVEANVGFFELAATPGALLVSRLL